MRTCIPVVCLALIACSASAVAQTRLLHHPTYSNGKVAFVYQNDLWVSGEDGNNVRRLTATKAAEALPTFSPDGKWLAYTSNREGYLAVFVMPAEGGESRQLTWFGGDRVVGWTPDSTKVVFFSSRGIGFGGTQSLWEVPAKGGLERRILADRASLGVYSPDMKRFAYNRHSVQAYRKHYRGSAAADLWVMDVEKKTFQRIEDPGYAGNFGWPMYGRDGFIYYVGDRLPNEQQVKPGSPEVMKSVFNIWKISERGGKPVQVTKHTSGNLYFPAMAGDGRTIVYEENFGIWKLDVASGKASEIMIRIDAPESEPAVQTITVDSEMEAFDLSLSTKRAAIEAKGRIFTIATEQGEARRVTDSAFHDRTPRWSPDGRKIAFFSDRSGRDEIWLSDERASAPRQLTNYEGEKAGYTWTPDSNSIVFTTNNTAVRVFLADGKQDVVVQGGIGVGGVQVSPDGQWLAYTMTTRESLERAFIKLLAGGEEHPISKKGSTRSNSLVWTPNGKKLLMLASSAGAVDTFQAVLYAITLQVEDRNPNYKGVDEEAEAAKPEAAERKPGSAVEVKIDWDRIDRRTRQVSRLSEHITGVAVSPDSKNYAVIAGGQVYLLDEDGARQTRLSPPGAAGMQFAKDGKTVYYRSGKAIMAATTTPPPAAAPGPGPAPRKVAFTAKFTTDMRERRRSVFLEAWRMIQDRYYDKSLNGVDWTATRRQYEPLLGFCNDQESVAELLRQMIGELNTSHSSAVAPLPPQTAQLARAGGSHPGFDLEEDASGFYRVSHILKNGPADRDYSRIHQGDYLLSVNGMDLRAGDNYWKAYRSATSQRFELTLNSKPAREGAWQTFVAPAVDSRTLYYDEWLAERRALVDKLSNGEFAYIHLRGMTPDILPQFEEDLYESRFKKGLILDVRFNGGGNLEMELLKILGQHPFLKLVTGPPQNNVFPRPFRGFNGSMVTIQNENSGSNAEMFPEGFRRLGLGKVVGMPTPGQVLLGSEYELSDGTRLLLGHGSVQTMDGVNLENRGTAPDVLVDNLPGDWVSGRDAQLEKAIEVLRGK
ncbi:MAG: S41 family peptidase [Candidatus Solibacter sp.]|nr:S41 family peptidase [Candidatus Solibacter sp.]